MMFKIKYYFWPKLQFAIFLLLASLSYPSYLSPIITSYQIKGGKGLKVQAKIMAGKCYDTTNLLATKSIDTPAWQR